MPNRTLGFDAVRKIGLSLPGVEEGTMYGSPALKHRGQLLACIPVHKSAEPNALGVRIPFDQRAELLAAAPETYYLKDHYVNYPMVLVRITHIDPDALRDLLGMAWRFVTGRIAARPAKGKLGRQ